MPAKTSLPDPLRKRQVAGLLLLLGMILAASIYRAGIAQVFPHGWWHIW